MGGWVDELMGGWSDGVDGVMRLCGHLGQDSPTPTPHPHHTCFTAPASEWVGRWVVADSLIIC